MEWWTSLAQTVISDKVMKVFIGIVDALCLLQPPFQLYNQNPRLKPSFQESMDSWRYAKRAPVEGHAKFISVESYIKLPRGHIWPNPSNQGTSLMEESSLQWAGLEWFTDIVLCIASNCSTWQVCWVYWQVNTNVNEAWPIQRMFGAYRVLSPSLNMIASYCSI